MRKKKLVKKKLTKKEIIRRKKRKIKLIMLIILIIIVYLICRAIAKGISAKKNESDKNLKEESSKSETIELEKYDNGLFLIDIPKGWKVEEGTTSLDTNNEYYTFTAYNPENSAYRIFFNIKTGGYIKTNTMRRTYKASHPDSLSGALPFIDLLTTANFYNNFTDGLTYFFGTTLKVPKINNFKTIEKLEKNALGGDILLATYTDENDKTIEGIFTATLKEVPLENVKAVNVYNTIFFTVPENELEDWIEVLSNSISSIRFSDSFVSSIEKIQDESLEFVKANEPIYEELSNSIKTKFEEKKTD